MKLCAACCEEQPKEKFSKKQWQLKQYQRRCKDCINDNRDAKMTKPPKPSCWICLEEGPDESGNPLRRDCSCRGDAGFAHLSCIVKYAETGHWDIIEREPDENMFKKISERWKHCFNCNQCYQKDLAVDLASKFISFVKTNHPYRKGSASQWLTIEAHFCKLRALSEMIGQDCFAVAEDVMTTDKLELERQRTQTKLLAHTLLDMTNQMKGDFSLPPYHVLNIEAHVYDILGIIAKKDGKESFETVVKYFERSRDIFKSFGHTVSVAQSEVKIACVKSMANGPSSTIRRDQLRDQKYLYEQSVKQFGEEDIGTIQDGSVLAAAHALMKHGIEAQRLLTKLFAICRRVHGPSHSITKEVEYGLNHSKTRFVRFFVTTPQTGKMQQRFKFLYYLEDDTRCAIQGPIINGEDEMKIAELYAVPTNHVVFNPATPVICHGLEDSDVNGKIGDLHTYDEDSEYYTVHFEDDNIEPKNVKWHNFRVLFNLPNRA